MRLVLGEVDACDADLLEAELATRMSRIELAELPERGVRGGRQCAFMGAAV